MKLSAAAVPKKIPEFENTFVYITSPQSIKTDLEQIHFVYSNLLEFSNQKRRKCMKSASIFDLALKRSASEPEINSFSCYTKNPFQLFRIFIHLTKLHFYRFLTSFHGVINKWKLVIRMLIAAKNRNERHRNKIERIFSVSQIDDSFAVFHFIKQSYSISCVASCVASVHWDIAI